MIADRTAGSRTAKQDGLGTSSMASGGTYYQNTLPPFLGHKDPMGYTNWLEKFNEMALIVGLPPHKQALVFGYMLSGEADIYYQSLRTDVKLNIEQLKTAFSYRFTPFSAEVTKFFHSKQGSTQPLKNFARTLYLDYWQALNLTDTDNFMLLHIFIQGMNTEWKQVYRTYVENEVPEGINDLWLLVATLELLAPELVHSTY